MNHARKAKHGWILTLFFSIVSVLYLYPIVLVVINSFKKKAYISRYPFRIPRDRMFVGLENYVRGLEKTGFLPAFGWTVLITVCSVALIILCCSMGQKSFIRCAFLPWLCLSRWKCIRCPKSPIC